MSPMLFRAASMVLMYGTIDVETNLYSFQNGTISGTLLGLEHMAKNQGGSGGVIVNIASISGTNRQL